MISHFGTKLDTSLDFTGTARWAIELGYQPLELMRYVLTTTLYRLFSYQKWASLTVHAFSEALEYSAVMSPLLRGFRDTPPPY